MAESKCILTLLFPVGCSCVAFSLFSVLCIIRCGEVLIIVLDVVELLQDDVDEEVLFSSISSVVE